VKKLPAIQFYTGDWLKDPRLSMCSAMTRGIWIDFLCAMHELDRVGELRGTPDQLARVARCSPVEIVQALDELSASAAAEVLQRNGVYTVTNRRMRREYLERKASNERVANFRKNKNVTNGNENVIDGERVESVDVRGQLTNGNGNVTSYSSSSSSNVLHSGSSNSSRANGSSGKPPPAAAVINSPKNGQWLELDAAEKLMSKKEFVEHLQTLHPTKNVRAIGKKLKEFCERHGKAFALERLKGWTVGEAETFTDDEFLAAFGDAETNVPAWQKAVNDCRLCDEKGLVRRNGRLTPCEHKQVKR
jgi:hypothetical protein